jgi:glycerophosphoryl diester phosphodiesterase
LNLRRQDGAPPLRIAHRVNSLDGLAGLGDVDFVELDVAPGLVVAHDAGASGPSLGEALDLLAPGSVGLHVDLKLPGYEQAVLEEIDARHLRDRVLVSTAYPSVARRVRALAPELPIAIGYPQDRYGVSRLHWPGALTRAGAAALRAAMPARVPVLLLQARASVLALHQALCSGAAIGAAHRGGAPVLVWTVNDPAAAARFSALGVDGVVSDSPEVLATLAAP